MIELIIDRNVEDIEFLDSQTISKVTLTENCHRIGDRAFFNSTLTEIVGLQYVKEIGNISFGCCPNFKFDFSTLNLNFTVKIAYGAFLKTGVYSSQNAVIFPDDFKVLGDKVFVGCEQMNGKYVYWNKKSLVGEPPKKIDQDPFDGLDVIKLKRLDNINKEEAVGLILSEFIKMNMT